VTPKSYEKKKKEKWRKKKKKHVIHLIRRLGDEWFRETCSSFVKLASIKLCARSIHFFTSKRGSASVNSSNDHFSRRRSPALPQTALIIAHHQRSIIPGGASAGKNYSPAGREKERRAVGEGRERGAFADMQFRASRSPINISRR